MKIETKFNVGDSVLFLYKSMLVRKKISRIEIVTSCLTPTDEGSVLIKYYFPDDDGVHRGSLYRYESELAATKEELISVLKEN